MPANKPMPKFTKAPEEMVALFGRVVEGLPEVETRRMFGYPAAFVHGQMFSSLFQDSMILRLSEADRAAFLKDQGARLFEPMPGRPMREYAAVPAAVLASEPLLRQWLRRAHSYAASLPPKPRKKASPAKKASAAKKR
jgi:TfoX/Sxy family transcriptional regulator of competence genes